MYVSEYGWITRLAGMKNFVGLIGATLRQNLRGLFSSWGFVKAAFERKLQMSFVRCLY